MRALVYCGDPLRIARKTHVLAIDAARKTGWAIFEIDGARLVESGCAKLKLKDDEMLDEFQSLLSRSCRESGVSRDQVVVAYETPFSHNKNRNNPGFGYRLEAALWLWCRESGSAYVGVAPAELKSWATGKGNAKKPVMVKAASDRFPGINILDDNHADALLVGAWALSEVIA